MADPEQHKTRRCTSPGCRSVVLNKDSEKCLLHDGLFNRNGPRRMHSDSRSPSAFPIPSANVLSRDPQVPQGNAKGESSRDGRGTSGRGTAGTGMSSTPSSIPRNTNLPPDLQIKHGLTARKSISSNGLSKNRSEMTSTEPRTVPSNPFQGPPPSKSSSSKSRLESETRLFRTSRPPLQSPKRPDSALLGKTAQNGVQLDAKVGMNGQGQHRATVEDYPDEEAQPVTQYDMGTGASAGPGSPSQLGAAGRRSRTKEAANPMNSSTGLPKDRDFRSLSVVKAGWGPPTRIKTAPPVPSYKRRRADSSSSISASTSSFDSDDHGGHDGDDEGDEDDEDDEDIVTQPMASTQIAVNGQGLYTGVTGAFGAVKEPQTTQTDLVHGGIQANGYNHNGYFPTRNTVPSLSFEGPQLGNGVVLPTIEQDHRQPHAAAAYAYPTRTSVLSSLTNGKRGFDAATFDTNLYSQAGASSPPPGVFVPARGLGPGPITEVKQLIAPEKVLYMHIDPRIHWAHDHSEEWYERKMEEIKARGGRKANFGKAAQRMRKQRLADEAAAALRKSRKRPHHRPPEPWSHHRPLDFADVPNEDLPRYVRNNPSWMKAVEWMRKNRRLNDEVNKQAASLIAEGRPWKHLFVNKRAKRA